jgi:hypothetical protein
MSTMPAQSPSPDKERTLDDMINGTISSAVVDTAFTFLEGLYCSPSGRRLAGGVQEVVTRAPHIASDAAKYGAENAIKGALARARRREDHWNAVVAYGSAAALFSMPVVGPLTAVSYGLLAAGEEAAFRAYVQLFRLDHRCRLPEPPARYAAGFPGFPVQSIVIEELSVDESG